MLSLGCFFCTILKIELLEAATQERSLVDRLVARWSCCLPCSILVLIGRYLPILQTAGLWIQEARPPEKFISVSKLPKELYEVVVTARTIFGATFQHASGMFWKVRFQQYSMTIRSQPPPPELMLSKTFWWAPKTQHKLPVTARKSPGDSWLAVTVPIRMDFWYKHFLGVGAFAQNPKIAECIGYIFFPAQTSNNKH